MIGFDLDPQHLLAGDRRGGLLRHPGGGGVREAQEQPLAGGAELAFGEFGTGLEQRDRRLSRARAGGSSCACEPRVGVRTLSDTDFIEPSVGKEACHGSADRPCPDNRVRHDQLQ